MRTPLKGTDYFSTQINTTVEMVEKIYLEVITTAIAKHKANAMLGDGTVAEVETFDPQNVQAFYKRIASTLKGWEFSGVSQSTTEDLHRLYCQFTKDVSKFHITGYFGVQFHALPYYKVDKRVIEIQKELTTIADSAAPAFQDMAAAADKVLESELEQKGYSNLDFQQLFTKIFEDEKLIEDLDKKAASVEDKFPQFKDMGKRKNELFAELNNLLVELYQTSPVLIDYNRLMQGEEGITTYFDIEVIKNKKMKKREPYPDTGKISKQEADAVSSELANISEVLRSAAVTY